MKQIYIIILCFVFVDVNAQHQVPAAPSAAAFNYKQFASSNTDYYDGSENITIPLGSVSEGPLSHEVSLHYNTKGIKVGTLPSQVGLGWNLNAGGMVSRSIRGISDGHSNGYGWYEMNDKGHSITDEQAADGDRDRESDLYHFSVGSFNGAFVIDDNNVIHTIPKSNVKIDLEWDNTYINYDFVRIIITDEYGTKYYFGLDGDNEYLEFRHYYDVGGSSDLKTRCCDDDDVNITGWFLYKIESYDGKNDLTFSYERTGYEYYSFAQQDMLKYYNHNSSSYGSGVHRYLGNDNDSQNTFSRSSVRSWNITGVYSETKDITFNNEDADSGMQREDLPLGISELICCSFPTNYY